MEIINFIDEGKLKEFVLNNKDPYKSGDPFPHIYVDNLFNDAELTEVLDEFPSFNDINWKRSNSDYEIKLASRSESQFGPKTKAFIRFLNSETFLKYIEELTGIENLIPDPYLNGGGLHQIRKGGYLKIHADFNKDSRTKLDRRLNLLVYMNKNWKEEYGGHFELWDKEMKEPKVRLLPIFNRMAIFSTTSYSYHGHPDPLTCPDDCSRKSIAVYYYTNGRPEEEVRDEHSTLFKARDNEKDIEVKFLRKKRRRALKRKIISLIKSFIPPILLGKWDPDGRF